MIGIGEAPLGYSMIRKSGNRFSEKIMLTKMLERNRFNLKRFRSRQFAIAAGRSRYVQNV
jgi:hypothetical protein